MNRKEKALEFIDAEYDIQITGRHLEITDAMKDYAMEKVSKMERFMNRIIDVNIIMDMQREDHRVEIILKVGHLKIRSQASTTDMYASIDKAVAKLEAQLLRYKSKLNDHHAKGHAVANMNVNIISAPKDAELDEVNDAIDGEFQELTKPHQILNQKTLPLKILTEEEAVMKMELSGDAFMLFKNEADQKLKVIYRLKDENYGIIEPTC